jgi:hypothetical protein
MNKQQKKELYESAVEAFKTANFIMAAVAIMLLLLLVATT